MIVPTGTDAPIYHWPIMTAVIMVANVVMFVLQLLIPEFTEMLWLEFGTLRPHTWITSAYLHADVGHIIGNLMFLFIFGIIVEGKIGWWRFALVYNLSAIAASIIINAISIFVIGSGLGASCAIFAIMAICFLWAPENEIQFHYGWIFYFRIYAGSFMAPVQYVCFFFFAVNLLTAAFTGFGISSAVFHLIGLLPGFVIGWAMLKFRQVNCDGHDFFSIWSGNKGREQFTVSEEAEKVSQKEERKEQRKLELQTAMKMVDRYIADEHFETAYKRFQSLTHTRPTLILSESRLVKIINGLESNPQQEHLYRVLLNYYLKHYTRLAVPVRLKLARRNVQQEQPRHAIKVLAELAKAELTDSQRQSVRKINDLAKRQIAEGVMEVRLDD
jgi:membrane associated rhomboid family serine protease